MRQETGSCGSNSGRGDSDSNRGVGRREWSGGRGQILDIDLKRGQIGSDDWLVRDVNERVDSRMT